MDLRYTVLEQGWVTSAYCKPVRRGISPVEQEDARIDFASFSPPSEETEKKLLSAFLEMARQVDVICVADQFDFGCVTAQIRDAVQALGKEGKLIVADSRERIGLFSSCVLKPNEFEATHSQKIAYQEGQTEKVEQAAKALAFKIKAGCAPL